MKIGIYNPRVGTKAAGGTETFLREMIKRCDETVELFTGDGELLEEVKRLDVTVHQVPVRYKEAQLNEFLSTHTPILSAEIESVSMFTNALRNGMLDRLNSCDVLSTHYYADNLLISRAADVPTVFRFAGIRDPSIRWRAMFTGDNADRYVANSKSTADRLAKWYSVEVSETVYAGVDVDQFTPGDGSSSEIPVVLFVGRLDEGKGVLDLINAVDNLDVRLRIVGDGNRRDAFESFARERLAPNKYEFVGEVSHDGIDEEYRMADVFCLPSYHESFGIVVLEALACGLPVVTTAIDAIEEYIDHEKNGLLFEPGDVATLEAHLRRLQDSADLRQRLSAAGRETALQYSWVAQTEKMTSVYRQLAE
jgi:glycosyltransferase involved in cell wall biosynthesis